MTDIIKNYSTLRNNHKNKALEVLKLAKEQEKQKLESGEYETVPGECRSSILKKIKC